MRSVTNLSASNENSGYCMYNKITSLSGPGRWVGAGSREPEQKQNPDQGSCHVTTVEDRGSYGQVSSPKVEIGDFASCYAAKFKLN